jgi:hypothetical protein
MKKQFTIFIIAAGMGLAVGLCGCQTNRGAAETPQNTVVGAGGGTAGTNAPTYAPGINPWEGSPAQWRGTQPVPP